MSTRRSMTRTRLLVMVLVVFGCVLGVLVAVPGAAIAGDGTSLVLFEEDEHHVESGGTITLEVVVYDHGDSSGDGLASLSFDVDYDPDVLTPAAVEHGPMLVAGDNVDLVTDSAVDDGTITVEQERAPVGDGGTGNEVAATITFEVHDDAGPASTVVDLTNAQAYRPSDWPVYPISRDATIHVDGGVEGTADDADDGSPAGVTFADDLEDDESGDEQVDDAGDDATDVPTADGTGDDEAASDGGGEASSSDGTETDAVPGFAALGTIAGIAGALAVWLRGRRP